MIPRTYSMATVLLAVAFALPCASCETTPVNAPLSVPKNEGVQTEIGKPLAAVNQVAAAALESAGFLIDRRDYQNGVVLLEAANAYGQRVQVRMSPMQQTRTHISVRPLDDVAEGVLLQIISAVRERVWN